MASKRLGKFRQWAGEVISTNKTVVTEEFQYLETDIELRRRGMLQIQQASANYHHFLSKKKALGFLPEESEKSAPRDALGIVMVAHGEDFGEDSAFGTSLVKFGQGMLKIAALQETYASTFQGTFLTSIQEYLDEIKDYQEQRKKLESRRLSYDAALNKVERLKNSKKEKDRQEADDELEATKSKYEDISYDVQIKMQAIQESEIDQLRELTGFLDMELRFAESYLDVMKDIRDDWPAESTLERVRKGTPRHTPHLFSSSVGKDSKYNSLEARKSSKSKMVDSSEDEGSNTIKMSNKLSGRRSDAEKPSRPASHTPSRSTSRPPSRPSSRASRKRSDSTTAAGEKDKGERQRKMSMSWASNAVSNMTGRGKKDKENFIGLDDGNDTDGEEHKSSPLLKNKSNSPSIPSRPPRSLFSASSHSSLRDKKIAKAVEDFSGSLDELSFKVGDEITMLNEVIDGWWMGELDGKKGLFPISHTEIILTRTSSAPAIPQSSSRWRLSFGGTSQEDDMSKKTLFGDDEELTSAAPTSDDDDHLFGDHNLVDHNRGPVYGIFNPAVENATDDEDHSLHRSSVESDLAYKVSSGKKPPPPPPPRRTPMSSSASIPPPLPDRNPPPLPNRSKSSPTVIKGPSFATPYVDSPFDSPVGPSSPSMDTKNPF